MLLYFGVRTKSDENIDAGKQLEEKGENKIKKCLTELLISLQTFTGTSHKMKSSSVNKLFFKIHISNHASP